MDNDFCKCHLKIADDINELKEQHKDCIVHRKETQKVLDDKINVRLFFWAGSGVGALILAVVGWLATSIHGIEYSVSSIQTNQAVMTEQIKTLSLNQIHFQKMIMKKP